MRRTAAGRKAISLGFLMLFAFTLMLPQTAQADGYFCRPYVRGDSAGTHVGTCRDIIVLPIDLRP